MSALSGGLAYRHIGKYVGSRLHFSGQVRRTRCRPGKCHRPPCHVAFPPSVYRAVQLRPHDARMWNAMGHCYQQVRRTCNPACRAVELTVPFAQAPGGGRTGLVLRRLAQHPAGQQFARPACAHFNKPPKTLGLSTHVEHRSNLGCWMLPSAATAERCLSTRKVWRCMNW